MIFVFVNRHRKYGHQFSRGITICFSSSHVTGYSTATPLLTSKTWLPNISISKSWWRSVQSYKRNMWRWFSTIFAKDIEVPCILKIDVPQSKFQWFLNSPNAELWPPKGEAVLPNGLLLPNAEEWPIWVDPKLNEGVPVAPKAGVLEVPNGVLEVPNAMFLKPQMLVEMMHQKMLRNQICCFQMLVVMAGWHQMVLFE